MSSGRLFEDFFPLSDRHALITTGEKLNRLDKIETISWKLMGDRVFFTSDPLEVVSAPNVRLGGVFDGKLVYSHSGGIVGADIFSPTAHQPFVKDNDIYYTDEWPKVKIHKHDGVSEFAEIYVDHFGQMQQVGNPCWIGDDLYFEARESVAPKDAGLWQIWRLRNGELEFVTYGANPAGLQNKLFWGEWNGKCFNYRCTKID